MFGDKNDCYFSLMEAVYEMIKKEFFNHQGNKDERVIDYLSLENLEGELQWSMQKESRSVEELIHFFQMVFKYRMKTNNSKFLASTSGNPSDAGLFGSILAEFINSSMYTFEVAAGFVLMENVIYDYIMSLCHWTNGRDGMFTPGGTSGNFYALNMARTFKFPECKEFGCGSIPTVHIYVSRMMAQQMRKAADFLGLGEDSVCIVPEDSEGSMQADKLALIIEEDKRLAICPLLVVAHSNVPFDPLTSIAKVCNQENIWLHVDASEGGACLFSSKHAHLLEGISGASSLLWSPHNVMGIPYQCSIFLVQKDTEIMKKAHSIGAAYLFQKDKNYDTKFDTGDKSIQCGRKVDVLKLWFTLQSLGKEGCTQLVDRKIEWAQKLARAIEERKSSFQLIRKVQFVYVLFWYIPSQLRGVDKTDKWKTEISEFQVKLKSELLLKGSLALSVVNVFVNDCPLQCLRVSSTNDLLQVSNVIAEIESVGDTVN